MDRRALDAWMAGCIRAWETNDPDEIGRLFTDDALYYAPIARALQRGRAAIVADWLSRKDEPGTWSFVHKLLAVCDDPSAGAGHAVGFVQGESSYAATATKPDRAYSHLWVIHLTPDGRCREFTEWWMELPNQESGIRPGRDTAPAQIQGEQTPLARILAHEAAYWTCIAAAAPRAGWTLYHNAALAGRIDPNHAGGFRAPEGTGAAIVEDLVAFYEALDTPPAAYVDALATPRDLAPCLLAAGFREWDGATSDLMLYLGPDAERPSPHAVTVVRTDRDAADWVEVIEEEADAETRRRLRRLYAAEIADPRVTAYLVRVDGHPAGRGELFSDDRLGRVEAVRTMAAYRGRGLAAAIVRRAVADSLAQGNALTYIYAEPNGAAQRLYERLGFRTVAANAIRAFVQ